MRGSAVKVDPAITLELTVREAQVLKAVMQQNGDARVTGLLNQMMGDVPTHSELQNIMSQAFFALFDALHDAGADTSAVTG